MPNSYHYFESSEVSHKRLFLEIEILKELQQAGLLHNLEWNSYDTIALNLFIQAGIQEANDELSRRSVNHSYDFEQLNFIDQCIQKHQTSPSINEQFKQQKISLPLIFNGIFIFLCLSFIIGFLIYEFIKFNHQHPLIKSLDHSLTTKRRYLSFTDDLLLILITLTSAIILGSIIIATRFSRKIILLAIVLLVITVSLLIMKSYQIIIFLLKYRELRWPALYDYLYL
ncbi:unnamed protein product [Adineta steineri]|uniref:Uncharacterized protein n=2 Tax=Adineta steineri TaxID=433720 RepID=A0A815HFW8_9BILA|nr:unnamed protein product [Adineta steineri]